jgi:hypothetical protein
VCDIADGEFTLTSWTFFLKSASKSSFSFLRPQSWTLYCMFFEKFVFFGSFGKLACAGCTVLGCLWQTSLCRNFGQQFFSGPRYGVNFYCLLSDKLRINIKLNRECHSYVYNEAVMLQGYC